MEEPGMRMIGETSWGCIIYDTGSILKVNHPYKWIFKCSSLQVHNLEVQMQVGSNSDALIHSDTCIAKYPHFQCVFTWTVDVDAGRIMVKFSAPSVPDITFLQSYRCFDICSRRESGYWDISTDGRYMEWYPSSCYLPPLSSLPSLPHVSSDTNISTHENNDDISDSVSISDGMRRVEMYFMGNSHIRNLFRCVSDIITDGKSWKEPVRYTNQTCDFTDKFNSCQSCNNTSKTHGQSYVLQWENIKSFFKWVVVWDLPNNVERTDDDDDEYCMNVDDSKECLIRHAFPDHFQYVSNEIGLDLLNTEIQTIFQEQGEEYHDEVVKKVLVVNFCRQYNDENVARKLADRLSLKPYTGKALVIVDANSNSNFEMVSMIFRKKKIKVIDLRSIYAQFPLMKSTSVSERPFTDTMHLSGPLQRLLVHVILANIFTFP